MSKHTCFFYILDDIEEVEVVKSPKVRYVPIRLESEMASTSTPQQRRMVLLEDEIRPRKYVPRPIRAVLKDDEVNI